MYIVRIYYTQNTKTSLVLRQALLHDSIQPCEIFFIFWFQQKVCKLRPRLLRTTIQNVNFFPDNIWKDVQTIMCKHVIVISCKGLRQNILTRHNTHKAKDDSNNWIVFQTYRTFIIVLHSMVLRLASLVKLKWVASWMTLDGKHTD